MFGAARLRSEKAVEKLDLEGDEKLGASIVKNALRYPLEAIASNAGHCLWSGIVAPDRARRVVGAGTWR